MSFAKNIFRNIGKKLSQKILDDAKQSATGAFKTASKRKIQKSVEATGDLIGNKTSAKITKVSKSSSQNNEEENIGLDREIHRNLLTI